MPDPHRIETEEQLREVIAQPNAVVAQKVFDHVDAFARAFIERSPLVLLATSDADGALDVSPKGDAPGFALVDDPKTVLLPDRPGNKLAYGFRNILATSRVGLIFVVPGVTETLRVNGSAELTRDPALLARLSARGKPALLATRVHVEESFFHCGKALVRAKLWKPDTWPEGVKANIGKQLAAKLKGGDNLATAIDEGIEKDYVERLY